MQMSLYIRSTSRNITLLLNFPYSFSHPITFSPGAAVAVAARILWLGLAYQSIRGRFSRLTFLPRELSTNSWNMVWCRMYSCVFISYLSVAISDPKGQRSGQGSIARLETGFTLVVCLVTDAEEFFFACDSLSAYTA